MQMLKVHNIINFVYILNFLCSHVRLEPNLIFERLITNRALRYTTAQNSRIDTGWTMRTGCPLPGLKKAIGSSD